jgi:hypothetical protein
MAKRKRKPGERKGFKFSPAKNYRSERYTFYIMSAETGILQAATIAPELTDGDVFQSLRNLSSRLQEPEALPILLSAASSDEASSEALEVTLDDSESRTNLVETLILNNLTLAFENHGPLDAEDVIGIFDVIRSSIKKWGVGMHGRGYLTYIEGFLGQMGVETRRLSDEEVRELGLEIDD